MKVLIRTDASRQIGTGHVMRCLTLARELRVRGATVVFACREHEGHLCDVLEREGFQVLRLPASTCAPALTDVLHHALWLGVDWQTDADQVEACMPDGGMTWDVLIVDHYGLDAHWESRMRKRFKRVMVIDDLADRSHECDWLLDQNFYLEASFRYDGRLPRSCERLLGPDYSLLRGEFREARSQVRFRTGSLRRLSVCFGGVDPTNETSKTLRALRGQSSAVLDIEVITGRHNPHLVEVQTLVAGMPNALLIVDASDMAERFLQADLAIGAAGATSWERACLGLPAMVTAVALNQEPIAEGLVAAGIATSLGPSRLVTEDAIAEEFERLRAQPEYLQAMGKRANELVDGHGTQRVVSRLLEEGGA